MGRIEDERDLKKMTIKSYKVYDERRKPYEKVYLYGLFFFVFWVLLHF